MLLPAGNAQAWFVSIDGSIAPLSQPLAGRVGLAAGVAKRHWQFEGSFSFIPVQAFTLYKGGSGGIAERMESYPLFLGAEGRYYVFSRTPFSKRHDMYIGGGMDFPVLPEAFLPSFKIGGGYSLRLTRKFFMEIGIDYHFFGALTNEFFVGTAFKGVF